MLTEFALLTALTLNSDERKGLRDKIDEWVESFLPKLERESTREEKCRLIASVERHDLDLRHYSKSAKKWRFFSFVGKKGLLFDGDKKQLLEFKATSFQKKILLRNPALSDVFIGRSEIMEETGEWTLDKTLKEKKISEGGEALILNQKFGETVMAVRVQAFDPFLFTKKSSADKIKWKTHLISDFQKANDENDIIYDINDPLMHKLVPIHENVIQNFVNVEIYDEEEEDCLGWLTVMEKCEKMNLRKKLKEEVLDLRERKKIAIGIEAGFQYLKNVGIFHFDKKLANFLLIGDVAKICDFGLVTSIGQGFRKLGYTRRGAKYLNLKSDALFAGTPGFAGEMQLGRFRFPLNGGGFENRDYYYFLFCDWKTSWSLIYRPIDEKQEKEIDKTLKNCNVQKLNAKDHVISNITKIISLPNAGDFCIDDHNLTKSYQMSNIRHQMTKCVKADMQNLTKNILNQKWSMLCVPISVTTLLRFAMKNDLDFSENNNKYTFERILTILTMIVYPRSLAGLNLNPKKEEKDFQKNDIETLLKRICCKTYLKESGWEIIKGIRHERPVDSICEYDQVILNENLVFDRLVWRPLTVTGAILFPNENEPSIHQMTIDRIENGEYVLQNNQFSDDPSAASSEMPVLRIKQTDPYYHTDYKFVNNLGGNLYKEGNIELKFVNKNCLMKYNRWYLFPSAYSLKLTKEFSFK